LTLKQNYLNLVTLFLVRDISVRYTYLSSDVQSGKWKVSISALSHISSAQNYKFACKSKIQHLLRKKM